jgi:hypothetical protein
MNLVGNYTLKLPLNQTDVCDMCPFEVWTCGRAIQRVAKSSRRFSFLFISEAFGSPQIGFRNVPDFFGLSDDIDLLCTTPKD